MQPILLKGKPLNVLDHDFQLYRSYLPLYEYETESALLETLADKVIVPAEHFVETERERHRPTS